MKLKISIAVMSLGLLAVLVFAEPQYTVTTTAVQPIAPDRTVVNGKAFVAGATNTVGTYIENTASPKQIYMALNTGTNGSTAPINISGTIVSGSITYYRVQTKDRTGLLISNVGTNTGYFTVGQPGSGTTPGVQLNPGGIVVFDKEVQTAIYAGTNATFSIQEY